MSKYCVYKEIISELIEGWNQSYGNHVNSIITPKLHSCFMYPVLFSVLCMLLILMFMCVIGSPKHVHWLPVLLS
jgi:hypothetical protein